MPTELEITQWYDKVYAGKGAESMRPYEAYPVFLDYLKVEQGKKLLDVSCGTGYLLLAAARRGLDTCGVDISSEAVNIAHKVSPDSRIEVGQAEDLKFDDKEFDYVTCLGSLEHFLDQDKGLQEMRRVANDQGRFCIMVPNSRFIFWKLSGSKGTEQQDINETLMTDKEWHALFKKNGLAVVKTYQDKWFGRRIRTFESANPIKICRNMFLKCAWSVLPLQWTYQFIYILKKDLT